MIERFLFEGLSHTLSSWLFLLDVIVIEKNNEIYENGEVSENSVALWKCLQIYKLEIDGAISEVGLDVDKKVS